MERAVPLGAVSQAVGLEEANVEDAAFCENKRMPCILRNLHNFFFLASLRSHRRSMHSLATFGSLIITGTRVFSCEKKRKAFSSDWSLRMSGGALKKGLGSTVGYCQGMLRGNAI